MKNIFLVFIFLAFACDSKINQEASSQYYDFNIMLGEVNWTGLTKQPYAQWFTPNYLNYQVDSTSLAYIEGKVEDIKIVSFIGTWCEDSQQQLPRFYKILDHLKFDLSNLKVIAIDGEENGIVITEQAAEYEADHVPTFIFYQGSEELGRISEFPKQTLEKDMVGIVLN